MRVRVAYTYTAGSGRIVNNVGGTEFADNTWLDTKGVINMPCRR